jgi:hypothetical protein
MNSNIQVIHLDNGSPRKIAQTDSNNGNKQTASMHRRQKSLEPLFRALLLIVVLVTITDLAIYWVLEHEGAPMDLKRNEGLPQHVLDMRMFTQEIDHLMIHNNDEEGKVNDIVGDAKLSNRTEKGKIREKHNSYPEIKKEKEKAHPAKSQTNNISSDAEDMDKSRIIEILKNSDVEVTAEDIENLPTWGEVKSLYGAEPKIIGLETCAKFRETVPAEDMYIAPAGIFNTGTNLLANNLAQFCKLPKREAVTTHDKTPGHGRKWKAGTMFQVPWGKHTPASLRLKHNAQLGSKDVIQTHVLPVVIVKDPYHWMVSMCRHSYQANWYHTEQHCPNLVPNRFDFGNRGITPNSGPINVNVRYTDDRSRISHHKGLTGLWNDWYAEYEEAGDEFPRLMIRYEDLLFHQKEVMTHICDCAGGELKNQHRMQLKDTSAKGNYGVHTGSSGLLSAIQRYGRAVQRVDGMTIDDKKYAEKALNPEFMKMFGYSYPPIDG